MMLRNHFLPRRWAICYSAVVTSLAILPVDVARSQDDVPKNKKVTKADSAKFDVIVHRPDSKNKKKDHSKKKDLSKPIAIVIYSADGSAQKIDISKFGFVTIDVDQKRVKMHPAGQPPKVVGMESTSKKGKPIRVALPKGAIPEKIAQKKKIALPNKGAKKIGHRAKVKKPSSDQERLDRLEAMIHELQKQMKSLHADIQQRNQ